MRWRVLVVALGIATGCSEGGGPLGPTVLPTPRGGDVLVGAGDIGECGVAGAERTARLLDDVAGTVVSLGDNAYYSGSLGDFGRCYHPFWGRHLGRTRPVPGNHEYEQPGAAPYYQYFGDAAGPIGLGYYSYTKPGWLIVALNSEIGVSMTSPQVAWLRSELAASPARCTLAYWHRPLFSSGQNGPNPDMQPMFRVLYEGGADVVLAGHEHLYERFAPQDPEGRPDPARGIRQFIVGTGGASPTFPIRTAVNSEARGSDWGVLKITLNATTYEWEFLPAAGGAFRDSGSGTCH